MIQPSARVRHRALWNYRMRFLILRNPSGAPWKGGILETGAGRPNGITAIDPSVFSLVGCQPGNYFSIIICSCFCSDKAPFLKYYILHVSVFNTPKAIRLSAWSGCVNDIWLEEKSHIRIITSNSSDCVRLFSIDELDVVWMITLQMLCRKVEAWLLLSMTLGFGII